MMSEETAKPWYNCPSCPHCRGPLVCDEVTAALRCAACGRNTIGTAAEREQARAADAAWEEEQRRNDAIIAEDLARTSKAAASWYQETRDEAAAE